MVIRSSGFRLNKEPEPTPPVGTPQNVQVSDGRNPGELNASCDRVPGARSYLFQYTLDPLAENPVWASVVSTKRRAVLKNLSSGKRYYVRVAAVGANDQTAYSNAVSRIVQ